MTDLTVALDDLDPVPAVRVLVQQLAAQQPVAADRRSDYVSLRPGGGGPVAVYVHRQHLDVAQPPALALAKSQGIPGATLDEKTAATTYLRIPAEATSTPGALAVLKEALAWRSGMPDTTSSGGSSSEPSASLPPVCRRCGTHHPGDC